MSGYNNGRHGPAAPLVEIEKLVKHFRLPGGWLSGGARYVQAVNGVTFEIGHGEVVGVVGESGCGKTTLGRLLLRLIEPSSGRIRFDGRDIRELPGQEMRRLRRQMQIVFQHPQSSLSPRLRVLDAIGEPLRTHGRTGSKLLRERVVELLEQVGLGAQYLARFPHELSGGQCQRVALARALALEPRLLVLDEPTSALDVSVQAQIINLLEELRQARGLTYLFISHDLSVVQHISDRIGVMYLGQLVELGPSEAVFARPAHPYTRALLAAIPCPEVGTKRERVVLSGTIPNPVAPPSGCRFHTRCPMAQPVCREREPALVEVHPGWQAACHFVEVGPESLNPAASGEERPGPASTPLEGNDV
jgi:oligopeptide transport system ATP-binding protein